MARRGILGGFQFILDCAKMLLLLPVRVQALAIQSGMKGEVRTFDPLGESWRRPHRKLHTPKHFPIVHRVS
jgi:hypothetical protein